MRTKPTLNGTSVRYSEYLSGCRSLLGAFRKLIDQGNGVFVQDAAHPQPTVSPRNQTTSEQLGFDTRS